MYMLTCYLVYRLGVCECRESAAPPAPPPAAWNGDTLLEKVWTEKQTVLELDSPISKVAIVTKMTLQAWVDLETAEQRERAAGVPDFSSFLQVLCNPQHLGLTKTGIFITLNTMINLDFRSKKQPVFPVFGGLFCRTSTAIFSYLYNLFFGSAGWWCVPVFRV